MADKTGCPNSKDTQTPLWLTLWSARATYNHLLGRKLLRLFLFVLAEEFNRDISFVSLSDKATNPLNRGEDWEYIMNFCDRVNVEQEGPEIACRLLGHKIQSPQEREAMQGLTVIEACVKNCGEAFHRQVGKFRFLNEMIKLISPKYLGTKSPASVQKKVIEIMYSWQAGLPEEPKIIEAYQMLKKQGLVKEDPVYMDKEFFPPPPPRPKNATFEDEEKSKLLARLLKSKHPEDL